MQLALAGCAKTNIAAETTIASAYKVGSEIRAPNSFEQLISAIMGQEIESWKHTIIQPI